jgi:tetratricopeptide (TPR) repeat protein
MLKGDMSLVGGKLNKGPERSRSEKFVAVITKGKGLMSEGNWVDAIACLAEAVKVARQEARPDLEVDAYDLIGEALAKKGDRDKAEKYLAKALDLAISKDDVLGQAATYKVYIHLSFLKGDREAAAKYLASMLEVGEKANLDAFKGLALVGLAHLANDAGDLAHAVEDFKKGIELLERTEGAEMRRELAKAYNGIGDALETVGDHARALTYFEKAKEEFLKEGDAHGRALAEVGVAECCTRLGFIVRAMEQLEGARTDLMKLKDNAGLGEVYRISGALMTAQGNWAAAKSHLEKAVSLLSKDQTNPRFIIGLVRAHAEIGRMFYVKDEPEKAEASFKDARDLAKKHGSKRLMDFVENVSKDSILKSEKR